MGDKQAADETAIREMESGLYSSDKSTVATFSHGFFSYVCGNIRKKSRNSDKIGKMKTVGETEIVFTDKERNYIGTELKQKWAD